MNTIEFHIPAGMEKETALFYDCCDFWQRMGVKKEDNIFDLRDAINEMCGTYNEIANRCGGDITIVDKKDFTCERVSEYVTIIHDDDVTTYMLAVVDHETDEDEIEEEDED